MTLPSHRTGALVASAVGALLLCGAPARADDGPRYAPPAPPPQGVPGRPAPPAQATPLAARQLDELVAPVALYPDVVLYSMLPAATAPSDVAAAARYVASAGGKVQGPPEGVDWDPNVVAMLQFPDVLAWMNENTAWLEQVGYAMVNQQADVLSAIQRYRAKAKAEGVLQTNEYEKVIVQSPQPDAQVIVIQPVQPQVVYVPSYDPYLVLDPSWSYAPQRPFFSSWYGYSFDSSPWAWNEIAWGYPGYYGAFYVHDDPWWWSGRRSSYYGRPYLWSPRYRNDWSWSRTGWRPSYTVRPTQPALSTAPGASRATVTMRPNYTVRPTARSTTTFQTTPSPVLRPNPAGTTGTTYPYGTYGRRDGTGATINTTPRTWNGTGTGTTIPTPNVRTTPRFTIPDTAPGTTPTPTPRIDTNPRWRIDTTPGRTRSDAGTTVPGVTPNPVITNPNPWRNYTPRTFENPIPRSRVDVWSRRGRASLDSGSNVTVTPRTVTVPNPTPRTVTVPTPRVTERPTYRVQPTDPREKDKDKDRR